MKYQKSNLFHLKFCQFNVLELNLVQLSDLTKNILLDLSGNLKSKRPFTIIFHYNLFNFLSFFQMFPLWFCTPFGFEDNP